MTLVLNTGANDLRELLTERYNYIDSWVDLAITFSNGLDSFVDRPRRELTTIRDVYTTDIINVRNTCKMLGLIYDNNLLSNDDWVRIAEHVAQHWSEKGTNFFVDFIGYIKNVIFTKIDLWTNDYINFTDIGGVPDNENTMNFRYFVPGHYYPTAHCGIEFDALVFNPAPSDNDVRQLFYKLAPIHLVLAWIAGYFNAPSVSEYLGAVTESTCLFTSLGVYTTTATLLYFEVTINDLHGPFYGNPGELQIGLATAAWPTASSAHVGINTGSEAQTEGVVLGADANGIGFYSALFDGTGINAFGTNYYAGFGISWTVGDTYGFCVDRANGYIYWRNITSGSLWSGGVYLGSATHLPASVSSEYSISAFGTNAFFIAISGNYNSTTFLSATAGEQSITLNTGGSAFVGTLPFDHSGARKADAWGSAWDATTVGPVITLSGNNLTAAWDDAAAAGQVQGVISTAGYTLV